MNDPDRYSWITMPDGTTFVPIPPSPACAVEVAIDGQRLRFEGPTPDAVGGDKTPAPRCEVCNWPLAASVAEGCVPGNCSYRPDPDSDEGRWIQQRREELRRAPSVERGRIISLPDGFQQTTVVDRDLVEAAECVIQHAGNAMLHASPFQARFTAHARKLAVALLEGLPKSDVESVWKADAPHVVEGQP